MPELEDPITEARRLLAERTPGEWVCPDRAYWELLNVHYVNLWAWADPDRRLSHSIGQAYQWADAALIAAAPRLLAALCERLEAAEHKHCRLHRCGNCAVCKKSGRWGSTVPAE